MKKRVLTYLFLFPLCACQAESKVPATDLSKPYWIYRNGDLFAADWEEDTVTDLTHSDPADKLLSEMGDGTAATFIKTSDSCHACQSFEPTLKKFLQTTFVDLICWRAQDNDFLSNRNALLNHYGDKIPQTSDHPFLQNTPTWYSGSIKQCSLTNWGSTSFTELWSHFFAENTLLPLYRFSRYDAWQKAIEDNDALLFWYDREDDVSLSFYQKTLFPLAKSAKKPIYLADVSRIEKTEQNLFRSSFGENDFDLAYRNRTYSLASEEAIQVIQDYCA